MNWHYYTDGVKTGPVTSAQLKELAQSGTITPDTQIETDTGKKSTANKVNGLVFGVPVPVSIPSSVPVNTVVGQTIEPEKLSYDESVAFTVVQNCFFTYSFATLLAIGLFLGGIILLVVSTIDNSPPFGILLLVASVVLAIWLYLSLQVVTFTTRKFTVTTGRVLYTGDGGRRCVFFAKKITKKFLKWQVFYCFESSERRSARYRLYCSAPCRMYSRTSSCVIPFVSLMISA